MTARKDWAGEPREIGGVDPTPAGIIPTAAAPVGPRDLDRLQMTVDAIGARVVYLVGVIGGAPTFGVMFGWWVGFLLLILAGGIPAGYQARKAHQRNAAREERVHADKFRGAHQGLVAGMLASAPTVQSRD